MQFALALPTQRVEHPDEFVTAEAIAEVTKAAAAAGFSAVHVTDHPAPDTKWLDHGGHHALDPFVALAFAAGADPGIRLLTYIYVAAYRNPFLGAQLVHSLDVLSGGRLVLGVAAGYLKAEFAALGVDFDRRGELLDEALGILDAVSTGADFTYEGSEFRARGVRLRPVPPSGRRPPIWIGGNSREAMRRAAKYEGWAPFPAPGGLARTARTAAMETLEDLRAAIGYLRSLGPAGREGAFDVCWSDLSLADASLSSDERCSRLASLEAAGVTWTATGVSGSTRAEVLDRVAAFGRDVIDQS